MEAAHLQASRQSSANAPQLETLFDAVPNQPLLALGNLSIQSLKAAQLNF